jgi:hypothetical protein
MNIRKALKFLLFIPFIIIGQTPPDTLWTKTFGGSEFNTGHFVQQTEDSGYIIQGIKIQMAIKMHGCSKLTQTVKNSGVKPLE